MANDITLPGTGQIVKTREGDGGHYQKSDLTKDMVFFNPTITVSTSGYADEDCIGGLLTFAGAGRVSGGPVQVESFAILDKQGTLLGRTFRVFFFSDVVAATNSVAFDPTPYLDTLMGVFQSGSIFVGYANSDWLIHFTREADFNVTWFPTKNLAGTTLYGVIVSDGIQFANTTDLELTLGVQRF